MFPFRLALLLLSAPLIPHAQDAGEPESGASPERHADSAGITHPLRFSTAHGMVLGRGRQFYNGYHLQDSLSLTYRQNAGGGRFSEDVSASSNEALQKGTLQQGDGGLTLKYKRAGFSIGANGGLTYATILYNKISRKEKQKTGTTPTASLRYGFSAGQDITLDADSTWETDLAEGYDDMGGAFRTWTVSNDLAKTLGDFEVHGKASGYHQNQDQSTVVCTTGKGKSCIDSASHASLNGFGIATEGDWNGDENIVSINAGMDWQFSGTVDRTFLIGLGYIYTPVKWLDLGANLQRETDLDAQKNSKFWLAATSFRLTF